MRGPQGTLLNFPDEHKTSEKLEWEARKDERAGSFGPVFRKVQLSTDDLWA